MPNYQKEWIGITLNECFFQGIVTEDPQIIEGQNGKVAFLNLRTVVGELAANGQWVDTNVVVPLLIMDPRKVEVVEKYVKEKRQLYVATYYKTWKDDQGVDRHGLVVTKMKLGSRGRPNKDAAPGLPS